MPKETVHYGRQWRAVPNKDGSTSGYVWDGAELNEGEYFTHDPDLSVHWDRYGNVQVSIRFEKRQWDACVEEHPEDARPEDKFSISTGTIPRSDLNAMIRALRKARDQAYGEDA